MPREDAIKAQGRIVEVLPKMRFRVELSNGHRFMARSLARDSSRAGCLASGDLVAVELSPYDLSRGLIVFANQAD